MPELPEVEFARQCLRRWLKGKELVSVDASATRVIRGSSAAALHALAGHRVREIERRGKWLLWELDGGLGVLCHLGMSGKLELQKSGEPEVRWSRVRFNRSDGATIHFQDPRMFGRVAAGPLDVLRRDEGFAALGPDAWDEPPSTADLLQHLQGRKRAIKDVLMDQTVVAGLGNIQVTDALWRARIYPKRAASKITREQATNLARAIHWSLKRTLAMNKGDKITYVEGSSLVENPFLVYGHAGEPCPRCGIELRSMQIGGRTTAFCPQCQPAR